VFAIVESSEQALPASAAPPGGGSVPPVELRVARVEVRVEHIESDIAEMKTDIRSLREAIDRLRDRMESDFRFTRAGIIASNLALAALMAKGFGWL
jgi:hypothetical protein